MSAPGPGEALPLSRSLALDPDPLALFRALKPADGGPAVLLESADGSTLAGERSILMTRAALRLTARGRVVRAAALGPQGRRVLPWLAEQIPGARLQGEALTVTYPPPPADSREADRLAAPSPIDALRALASWRLVARPARRCLLLPGVFAYDLLECYEDLPGGQDDPLDWPGYEFFLPEELVVIDHRNARCQVIALVYGGEGAQAAYHDAARRIDALAEACARAPRSLAAPVSRAPELRESEVAADMSAEDYAAQVRKLKELIRAGEVYQIVPSRTFVAPCPDPIGAYARLRALNPSPYMFLFLDRERCLFGASPETAVKVSGDDEKTIELCPIAGTRPRGKDEDGRIDPELDARIELSLRTDQKELAEHLMLVDIARNDVARVSVAGTRAVSRLMTVDRYSHVMHLVSRVQGQLRPELDALQAYVASMNMGTLVGAPKLRAAQLLRGAEATRRGPYGGAVGYLTPDGELDTCIVIRSAAVVDGVAHVRAGAGVVHDSEPMAEADETRRKANAVLQALRGGEA